MNLHLAKESVGKAAAALIQSDMLVGLGTGSTAECFITSLIERHRQGLNITAVATSQRSYEQAAAGGIPMRNMTEVLSVDLTVDGADEIDSQKRMIKGGGGALLREKIIASISNEVVIIVDESKLVDQLGTFPLPVEIVPFAYKAIINKIESIGYSGNLRQRDNKNYITDNGNFIFDIHFKQKLTNPEEDQKKIRSIPGVVETGLFFNLANRVLIGCSDGSVKVR